LRRILLTATWLAGTLIATGAVYAAVNAVAGQVTEQRSQALSPAGVDHALQQKDQGTPSPSPPASSATPTAAAEPSPSPPTTTSPGPSQSPTTPPARPGPTDTRTFALIGGTASMSCAGDQISLNWATPNGGYQVETGSSNGGAQLEVRFRSDTHESRLEAWCSAGQIQSAVREESS